MVPTTSISLKKVLLLFLLGLLDSSIRAIRRPLTTSLAPAFLNTHAVKDSSQYPRSREKEYFLPL